MKESSAQPLRGEAAWRASAAQAEGARKRAEKVAAADREAAKLARREARDLPQQPGR